MNPVHQRPFADPYVLKHDGTYWGFSTGRSPDGRCFAVASSKDLVRWREHPGAMDPLAEQAPCYWAPEVVRVGARFVLYYSVGNEETMQVRAAVASHPGGPYVDAGRRLTREPFAIDPHVFEDEDGTRWLFYATDFLEHTHVGTGTVRDRLLDPLATEGRPQVVTRPHHTWQLYDPHRKEKGGVRWHTVEGPFVLKRRGVYYQMFSGGNWKDVTYGVAYATTRSLHAPEEWTQHADGDRVLPTLRTIPGRVNGPGHNSVVAGPDNRQLFCVYHRWDAAAGERVLCIDRLDWAGDRLLVLGPSDGPEPAPLPPTRVLRAGAGQDVSLPAPAALLHWTAAPRPGRPLEIVLSARGLPVWSCRVGAEDGLSCGDTHLPCDGEGGPWSLRLELNGRALRLAVEGRARRFPALLPAVPDALFLTGPGEAHFTLGFEDLFEEGEASLEALGWGVESGRWRLERDGLVASGAGSIVKDFPVAAAEVVLSARALAGGGYGLALLSPGGEVEFTVEPDGEGWRAAGRSPSRRFDGAAFQLLRLRSDAGGTRLWWEGEFLREFPPLQGPVRLRLRASGTGAVFDAARVTSGGVEDEA